MFKDVYHAYGYVTRAAAVVSRDTDRLARWKAEAMVRAADEAIAGNVMGGFRTAKLCSCM
jgi:fumarate hydratase, class II